MKSEGSICPMNSRGKKNPSLVFDFFPPIASKTSAIRESETGFQRETRERGKENTL